MVCHTMIFIHFFLSLPVVTRTAPNLRDRSAAQMWGGLSIEVLAIKCPTHTGS